MNCTQIEELLPAYALGALDPADRQAVEEHLQECPYCKPLAAEHLEAAAALASLAPSATPPAHLRGRILARTGGHTDLETPLTPVGARAWGSRRRWWGVASYAVAASLGLLLLGVLMGVTLGLRQEAHALREQNARLYAMINDQRSLVYVAALPGIETMLLENTGVVPKARGMLMVNQDRTWGMLVSQGLEPLHKSLVYQVWLNKDGERMSGGIFTVDQVGYGQISIKFPVPYEELGGIGITKEPSQGSTGPTSPAVLLGKMRQARSDLVQGDW